MDSYWRVPCVLLYVCWERGWGCVHVYLWVRVWVSAGGAGLQASGAHLSRCQQMGRLRSRAWTDHLKPVAGGIHVVYGYIFSINRPSSWSAIEGNRMRLLVVCVYVSAAFSVCIDLCGWPCVCVYVYCISVCVPACACMLLSEVHVQPHYWLNLGTRTYCSLASTGLLDLATPNWNVNSAK